MNRREMPSYESKKMALALPTFCLLGLLAKAAPSFADCLGTLSGPIKIEISQCQAIEPSRYFASAVRLPEWFHAAYPPKEAASILQAYTGVLVKGQVRASQAVDTGVGDRSALFGQTATFFLPGKAVDCTPFGKGAMLSVAVKRVCCESSGEAPCFLETPYVLSASLPKAALPKLTTEPQASSPNPDLESARHLFRAEKLDEAIVAFTRAASKEALDPMSSYLLGLAYYLGPKDYAKASIAFESVRTYFHKNEGIEVKPFIKRAFLLLARSQAILKNADQAGIVLDEMLADPDAFNEEIRLAMQHPDFGWIKSTREYQAFLARARRVLAAPPAK